ncbi:MAG: UDP-3-O-(3-hydroxymyristoyl)glucosamine N-acyltransferase [Candidatus Omnitrophota bacterium]
MELTVKEIAKLLSGEVVGDPDIKIKGVCGIKESKPGDITFIANSRYNPLMDNTQASCVITSRDVKNAPRTIIRTENPSLAFAKIVSVFWPEQIKHPTGMHATATIGKNVKLGKDVAVDANAVLEDNCEIGDRTIIYAGVYVGHNAKIGADCIIYPNVTIRDNLTIGNRVSVHSGTVIGSDGFGFATVKGLHHKIPQIGTVIIEDDVEIGSNVAIDRARFGKTIVGKGTKIDNLVQIAHNVVLGENCIVIAQTGISGSTEVKNNVTFAGQSGTVGHITIGENSVIAAQAGVTKAVPPNTCVSGYPAKPHHIAKRINACMQRLPILFKIISGIDKRIKELEKAYGVAAHDKVPRQH